MIIVKLIVKLIAKLITALIITLIILVSSWSPSSPDLRWRTSYPVPWTASCAPAAMPRSDPTLCHATVSNPEWYRSYVPTAPALVPCISVACGTSLGTISFLHSKISAICFHYYIICFSFNFMYGADIKVINAINVGIDCSAANHYLYYKSWNWRKVELYLFCYCLTLMCCHCYYVHAHFNIARFHYQNYNFNLNFKAITYYLLFIKFNSFIIIIGHHLFCWKKSSYLIKVLNLVSFVCFIDVMNFIRCII